MTTPQRGASRGRTWFEALVTQGTDLPDTVAGPETASAAATAGRADSIASVLCADAALGGEVARFLAVVADPDNPFPRARSGEIGVREAWVLAAKVREVVEADAKRAVRRPIVAIVDTVGQAYGRLEELLGIHLAFAAAVEAYASARLAGHPVVALLVGPAISGAFLAHGLQASCILALDDPGVTVHAMRKDAAARVLRRPVTELDALGEAVPPMSYDIHAFAQLGLLHRLITGVNAGAPSADDVARVTGELGAAVARVRAGPLDALHRVSLESARTNSAGSEARRRLTLEWELVPR